MVQAIGKPDELQTQLRQHSVAPEPLHTGGGEGKGDTPG